MDPVKWLNKNHTDVTAERGTAVCILTMGLLPVPNKLILENDFMLSLADSRRSKARGPDAENVHTGGGGGLKI